MNISLLPFLFSFIFIPSRVWRRTVTSFMFTPVSKEQLYYLALGWRPKDHETMKTDPCWPRLSDENRDPVRRIKLQQPMPHWRNVFFTKELLDWANFTFINGRKSEFSVALAMNEWVLTAHFASTP